MKLTVDHVLPVALGGADDPSNLATACRDCNAGKSSTSPNEHHVAQVAEDAVRWANAMRMAAENAVNQREEDEKVTVFWYDELWPRRLQGALPEEWEKSILQVYRAGLSLDDIQRVIGIMYAAEWKFDDPFRYHMGVCHSMLRDRAQDARALIDSGRV